MRSATLSNRLVIFSTLLETSTVIFNVSAISASCVCDPSATKVALTAICSLAVLVCSALAVNCSAVEATSKEFSTTSFKMLRSDSHITLKSEASSPTSSFDRTLRGSTCKFPLVTNFICSAIFNIGLVNDSASKSEPMIPRRVLMTAREIINILPDW
ncbi:hypothetical protein D3C81_1477720 [compost metagenome]